MMTTTLGSLSSGAIPRADASSPALPRRDDDPDGLLSVQTRTSSATAMIPIMSAKPRRRYGVGVLQNAGCAPWPTATIASPALIGLMTNDGAHGSIPLLLIFLLSVSSSLCAYSKQSGGFSLVLCGWL
ncbi:hypothetical protein VPH35_138730 [Triticum aestivum]